MQFPLFQELFYSKCHCWMSLCFFSTGGLLLSWLWSCTRITNQSLEMKVVVDKSTVPMIIGLENMLLLLQFCCNYTFYCDIFYKAIGHKGGVVRYMSIVLQLVGLEKICCTASSIRRCTNAFMATLVIKNIGDTKWLF